MSIVGDDGTTVAIQRNQVRTVVAILVAERHRTVTRSELAYELWPDNLPPHWAGAIRGVISKIRDHLNDAGLSESLIRTTNGWRLDLDRVDHEVTIDYELARDLVRSVDPDLEELASALHCLRDEFAPGASSERIDQCRDELARARWQAALLVTERARNASRFNLAFDAANTLVHLDPYSDEAARALIASLAAAGNRSGALKAADEFTSLLHDDLGVAPDEQTLRLIDQVRGRGLSDRTATGIQPKRPHLDLNIATTPLAGRSVQLEALKRSWRTVSTGAGARAILLKGDAGAGKTRLAWEAIQLVDPELGDVLWGRCNPDRRVSFDPVAEALGRAATQGRFTGIADQQFIHDLSDIVYEFRSWTQDSDEDASNSHSAARDTLFPAFSAAVNAAVTRPTIWVIDDLHWANSDTYELLAHLAAMISVLPILLVATTRHTDESSAVALEALARQVPTVTLELPGLTSTAIGELLSDAGISNAGDIEAEVQRRTGGNPFYVNELIHSAGNDGVLDPTGVPESLRSWITQRVEALAQPTRSLLQAAAVIGTTTEVALLAQVTGEQDEVIIEQVTTLVSSGLLVASPSGDEVSFPHVITRDAVYDAMASFERSYLHRAVADALELDESHTNIAEIARHLALAGSKVHERAMQAMLAAGEEALGMTAWDSALRWFSDVLERRDDSHSDDLRSGDPTSVAHLDALRGMGAALRGQGDRIGARQVLNEVLDMAIALGDTRREALTVLGLVGGGARGVSDDMADEDRAWILRTAINRLGPDDADLLIPLQLELSTALLLSGDDDERCNSAKSALDLARSLDRPDLLARALVGGRLFHHGPETAELRLAEVAEALAIDRRSRSHEVTLSALMSRHEDALLVGDRALARAALEDAASVLTRFHHPYWRWVVATWRALGLVIDGRLDDAEAAVFEAVEFQSDHPEAIACMGVTLVDIRLFQGRAAEVIDLLSAAVADNPHIPAYRAVLALCLCQAGESERANAEFAFFAGAGFTNIPQDTNRLLSLAVLADVAATQEHVEAARTLYTLLAPHSSRQVILNCFGGGGAFWGPVARQLGRLAVLMGEDALGMAHLDAASASAIEFNSP